MVEVSITDRGINMDNIYERWQENIIKEALKTRRVLILSGARQAGKTTLSRGLVTEDVIYRTLDNSNFLEAAKNNPQDFIRHSASMMIIDEVQQVPNLILAIKEAVDINNSPGQYLLTGSSNIQSLASVKESLAGRVRKIRLRNLTQGEVIGSKPLFLQRAFDQSFGNHNYICSQDDIVERALKGGFPEAIKLEENERKQWHHDYISSLLERDLKDIANIRRLDSMRSLVWVLAAWSSKFIDIAAIRSGLSIQRSTIESYINALEMLYLVERVPPWYKTDYGFVGKRSKLFMTDCGLMSSILNWKSGQIRFNGDQLGKLVETFIFNEISAQIDVNPYEYKLFHYRDKQKREIDFLVERDDGSILGIEVKSGSAVDRKSFNHLQFFKERIAGERPFISIVLYSGNDVLSYGNDMWIIPISALWNE